MTAQQTQQRTDGNIEHRVTAIEVDLNGLARGLKELSESVNDNAIEQRKYNAMVMDKLSQQGRLSWPLVVSCVMGVVSLIGLAVTVLTLIGALSIAPVKAELAHLASGLEALDKRIVDHEQSPGHLETVALIGQLETRTQVQAAELNAKCVEIEKNFQRYKEH